MKYLVILSAVISLGLIIAGIYFDYQDDPIKHKLYGFGTIFMFLITFPLFLYWRRNKMTREKFLWKNSNSTENKKTEE